MVIDDLKKNTCHKLIAVEDRIPFVPGLSVADQPNRKYNTVRPLRDYHDKFPQLTVYLKDNIELLEIGAGDGLALNAIRQSFKINAIGTNLQEDNPAGSVKALACDLPFKSNYFDVVIAIHSITWEPDQKTVIKEVYRVLKTGGTGFINLFKFSEIASLWFGASFWENYSLNEYIDQYQFNGFDYQNKAGYRLRQETVSVNFKPITNSFFLQIDKI